jgi:ABC-type Fe3+-hydroxamate transport system substrate-binding protein
MRQYLKQEEKWKEWEGVEMKWISHHNPDVVILDDSGKEKERHDLQGWTASKLEKFLESKGVKRR